MHVYMSAPLWLNTRVDDSKKKQENNVMARSLCSLNMGTKVLNLTNTR